MHKMNSISLEEEMRKNPSLTSVDLQSLREWYSSQAHLPKIADNELILFLHRSHNCVESAKINVENYFSMRATLPEFFAQRDPDAAEIHKVYDNTTVVILNKPTAEGYKVVLARLMDPDPENYDFNNAVKVMNMVLDVDVLKNGTHKGYVVIFDLENVSIQHLAKLSLMDLKKYFDYFRKGSPFRWIGQYYVNSGKIEDGIADAVKVNIIKSKFADSVYYNSSLASLSEVVPLEILPKDMGGKGESLAVLQKAQVQKLKRHHSWFFSTESCTIVD